MGGTLQGRNFYKADYSGRLVKVVKVDFLLDSYWISVEYVFAAWESGRVAAEPLWQSTRGTFFYSVPHRGSPLADFNLPLLRQSVELLEIRKSWYSWLELRTFAKLLIALLCVFRLPQYIGFASEVRGSVS